MKTKTTNQIAVLKAIANDLLNDRDSSIESVARDTNLTRADVAKATRIKEIIVDNDDGLHIDFSTFKGVAKTKRDAVNIILAM